MANLKIIRTRITSVRSTRQITNAMKMVSAAKLRKAQDAIIQIRPYYNKLRNILKDLDPDLDLINKNVYSIVREPQKKLLVVITSNRGLCGNFNSNVTKKAMQLADEYYKGQKANGSTDIIAIGKKGKDYLKSKKYKITESYTDIFDMLNYENALPIVIKIMDAFVNGKYDKVDIIYNQFKNAAVQVMVEEQFLPIVYKQKIEDRFEERPIYIYEPAREDIINELIPKSLKVQFYRVLLDSAASEHGARMTAMHKATDNATDLIRELQLDYNKARQASITKEILEIVGGAEALNK
jgi:F-type H+-transporting ATPase subunit gamma